MTVLTVTLLPAAADHYGEKGWTLVRRPMVTRTMPTTEARMTFPARATETCPKCQGRGWYSRSEPVAYRAPSCPTCNGSGAVARAVEVERPCAECCGYGRLRGEWDDASGWVWNDCACLSAWNATHGIGDGFPTPLHNPTTTPVGRATVTEVPVIARMEECNDEVFVRHVEPADWPEAGTLAMRVGRAPGCGVYVDVTPLFGTPPTPGTVVWLLTAEV